MSFDWCVLWDPTFILGIWHGGDWLKRDLALPIYGRVECGSPITGWLIAFINEKIHSLDFHVKMYWCIYGFWWMTCLLYLCSYYVVYMHIYSRGCYKYHQRMIHVEVQMTSHIYKKWHEQSEDNCSKLKWSKLSTLNFENKVF